MIIFLFQKHCRTIWGEALMFLKNTNKITIMSVSLAESKVLMKNEIIR